MTPGVYSNEQCQENPLPRVMPQPCQDPTHSTQKFDLGSQRGRYLYPADINKYQTRRREQTEGSYRFRNFESRFYVVVRFVPCKVRCGRTVHSDGDTGCSRLSSVGIIERRQVYSVIRIGSVIGPGGRRPITEAVPTVQPERGESQMSKAHNNTPLTWPGMS